MFFVLVGCHEWGHFFFAKRAGILVREFAIGFGPKVFSYKRGETRYTIRLFPLGGFVRMAGEDPELVEIQNGQTVAVTLEDDRITKIYLDQLDSRKSTLRGVVERFDLERELQMTLDVDGDLITHRIDPQALLIARGKETQIAPWDRQFGSKTVGQRAMAIFAGPMMNFILAFLLFIVFVYMTGITVDNPDHIVISSISEDAPAEAAGLRKGDVVRSIDGVAIGADREKMIELIQKSPEKPMQWEIVRNDKMHTMTVTPEAQSSDNGTIGIVGVGIAYPTRAPTVGELLPRAWDTMIASGKQIFTGLKMLVTLQVKMDDLGGPVRITEVTGEAVSHGMNMYIFWAGILSLYFGIFNLLPFPALDGSRLMFFALEAVRGKPVDPHRESMVHFIGFAMLMLLMIAVTYNDILRLFRS